MPTTSGTGTLHQAGNLIFSAHLPQGIYFFHPSVIPVGKIRHLPALLVVVEIKHQKSAGSIRKKRINTDHIRSIRLFSPQMGYDLLCFQAAPFSVCTVTAFYPFAVLLRAEPHRPQVFALRIIPNLTCRFMDASLAVNIRTTPEIRKKAAGQLFCNFCRMYLWRS